jgi:hypothetical protein
MFSFFVPNLLTTIDSLCQCIQCWPKRIQITKFLAVSYLILTTTTRSHPNSLHI